MSDQQPPAPITNSIQPTGSEPAGTPPPEVDLKPIWEVVRRLPAYARLAAALARDPRVPRKSKAMLAAGGAYAISPIDLVPGIIPVAGQLDDLYVVLTGLQQAIRTCPSDLIDEHFRAVGLAPAIVDEDLATIRVFVRQGLGWALRRGSKAAAGLTRQARALAARARTRGGSTNDQDPL